MKKILLALVCSFCLVGCGTNKPISSSISNKEDNGDVMKDFLPEVGEVKLLFKHSDTETIGDDGEDYFYNYCPSIKIENNTEHVYYCTNQIWGNVTDFIGYRQGKIIDGKLQFSQENIVISPTDDTWDERHTCDPSVIKGEFIYNNETYFYLMTFLGCVTSDCTLNGCFP